MMDGMSTSAPKPLTRRTTPPVWTRVLSVATAAFLAFCTSVGPDFRTGGSLADFGPLNGVLAVVSFAAYLALMYYATRWLSSRHSRDVLPSGLTDTNHGVRLAAAVNRVSRNRTTLFVTFVIGWAWVPLLLWGIFGADVTGQSGEVSNWLTSLMGGTVPYKTDFSQLDVYPIAHYLWPQNPTFLSNHHNLVLTLFYGLVWNFSETVLHTAFPAALFLGLLHLAFAAFCCAATVHRFFTLREGVTPTIKTVTLGILLLSPVVVLSTIALTKSPLFGFASFWWTGVLFEAIWTKGKLRRGTVWELAGSTLVMLISAKYAMYIIAVEAVVLLIANRTHWKAWLLALLAPTAVFEGLLLVLTGTGAIINGDSVESKALQIQQIARVAKYSPQSFSASDRAALEPIFDLEEMAKAYNPNDADPVKSSGGIDKPTTYKWRTVTAADWEKFTSAWLSVGKKAPLLYADAFVAEFYGYFDVLDEPYVSVLYYTDSPAVTGTFSYAIAAFPPRGAIIGFMKGWSSVPVLGWVFHGNFWVIATLLACAVTLRLRRYRDLLWMLPLLVQMGVMVMAPANNFDRHMIGIAVTFSAVLLNLVTREHYSRRLVTAD